jgi:hypothetical protein
LSLLRQRGEDVSDIHLAIVGSGAQAYIQTIRKFIDETNLQTQVHLLGPRNDIPDLLDASDCFVLASTQEGAPISIIEAMAKGIPIVATRVGDIPDMVDQSCAVLLSSSASDQNQCAAELAEVLLQIKAHPAKINGMGAHAHTRARSMFDSHAAVNQYVSLIDEAVQIHSAHRDPPTRIEVPRLSAGQILHFNDVKIWNALGEGWSVSERRGIWTDGPYSTMTLKLGETTRPVRLRFLVKPFVNVYRPHQQVDILANGTKVGSWIANKSGRQYFGVTVPPDLLASSRGIVEFRFIHRFSCSPAEIGLSQDPRSLSFYFIFVFVQDGRANTWTDYIEAGHLRMRANVGCATAKTGQIFKNAWRAVKPWVRNRHHKLSATLPGAEGDSSTS